MDKIDKFASFLTDVLAISKPKVFKKMLDRDRNNYAKAYLAENGEIHIYINSEKEEIMNDDEVLLCFMAHEFRHAHQFLCIAGFIEENPQLLNLWKKEISNYIPFGKDGYLNQYLEIDAYAFANVILTAVGFSPRLFPYMSKDDQFNIIKHSNYLKDEFTVEEIQESFDYCLPGYRIKKKMN